MFLHEPHEQAEYGGGGNRTRERFLHDPHLTYVSGWSNLAQLHQRSAVEKHIAERDGGKICFYCGTGGFNVRLQLDHVTPRFRGGSDSVENLVLACKPCNTDKSTWPGWLYVLREARLLARIGALRMERRASVLSPVTQTTGERPTGAGGEQP